MMVSGGVSGGHLNPAITVAVASVGKFPWWKVMNNDDSCLILIMTPSLLPQVPHYMAAQYLGSLTASVTVFLAYWDSLVWYEHDRGEYRSVRDDWCQDDISLWSGQFRTLPGYSPPTRRHISAGSGASWTSSSAPRCSSSASVPSLTTGKSSDKKLGKKAITDNCLET